MPELWIMALAAVAVITGTTLQRVSGAGVGLVVSPVFVLLFGGAAGVMASNMTTLISASVLLVAVRREVNWSKAGKILAGAFPGAVIGALCVLWLPSAWLAIVIGCIVLSAVLVTRFTPELPHWDNGAALGMTSVIAGAFNTTAGVAAPALIVYSRLSRWDMHEMRATFQPLFLGMAIMSLVFKSALGATGFAEPPVWILLVAPIPVLLGLLLGTKLAARVTKERAQQLSLALAGVGGVGAIGRGVLGLMGAGA